MPREFLPLKRQRESHGKAELFPRSEARVMAGPSCDRMIETGETANRRRAKQALGELTARPEADYVHD